MSPPASARLELRDVSLRYGRGAEPALKGLSLTVEPGELVALLGPSGCGKTTALKIVAGLLAPTSGEVLVDGRSLLGVPPEKRGAAMVFQKPLLFPHMSVEANVGFGLRMRGASQAESSARAREALGRVRMEGHGDRRPDELSGGQQQRVSLARALVTEPSLLLLDEPLSALDANLRSALRDLVREVQEEGGYTTVFVTHDQEEAVVLADRIALVTGGALRMYDRPQAFYDRPRTREVAEFFGATNFIEGRSAGPDGPVETALGTFGLATPVPAGKVTLTIRPEAVRLGTQSEDGGNSFVARVSEATYLGTQISYRLQAGDTSLRAALPPHTRLAVGERTTVRLPAESLWPLGP
ncbi:ATP-binding cassette domain-containing protein [Rubrobacter marinus]|uniref:ABC-type quaternary amine transporter n=1 Tax=Rubrobacter marinus TaxID=2653852 RepID=A0A6G8Q020_9ACTN|nr:ABC transporter ATP-binding protein [Rubrobacter marinus]QIN79768.1 ATP-binding cassette domain-containing protein [Rubrobacter marinus]